MIITVGHEKGGCGKTTTATNLAVWLRLQGADVLLVDADKQASASHWSAVREQDARVQAVSSVQLSGNISAGVRDLSSRYEHVVVDCGGRDSAELRSSLVVADVLLAPMRPSQLDLWALDHLTELVEAAQMLNPGLRAVALLTLAPTNARVRETAAAQEMLEGQGVFSLARTILYDRKAYRDAICGGWSVLEMDDRKAESEINTLGDELYGQAQVSQCAAAAV